MVTQRMDKIAFLKTLEGRTPEDLRTLLWTAYWRGTAAARERIEELLAPQAAARKREEAARIDPDECLQEVGAFCEAARNGDYMRGARSLGRKEVSGWRFTLRRLFDEAGSLLQQGDFSEGAEALETLLDLTHELKGYEYFRSEDPVEAAKIVVSDRVEALWRAMIGQEGFGTFVGSAPGQLARWEEPYGWTRYGGPTSEKERRLAEVLMRLLPGADGLLVFARAYLEALNGFRPLPADPKARRGSHDDSHREYARACESRADRLEVWHTRLLERMGGTEDEGVLEAILKHPAVQGPETWHLRSRLLWSRGRTEEARTWIAKALDRHPGSQEVQASARAMGLKA